MRRGRIQPFDANFVIFLQEVIVDPGKTQAEKADIHMAAGKQATDWRGAAIAHNSAVTQPDETLAMRSVLYAAVGGQRFTGLSGHLPHHATIAETAAILDSWSAQLDGCFRGLLGWDANETFVLHAANKILTSQTARAEHILNWLAPVNSSSTSPTSRSTSACRPRHARPRLARPPHRALP